MEDSKKIVKMWVKGSRGNLFLGFIFGVAFLISLGAVLERNYSITAKISTVVENTTRRVAVFISGNDIPTVYTEWGGRGCTRIETPDGRNPSCDSPEGKSILKGDYNWERVPYPSQKVVGR